MSAHLPVLPIILPLVIGALMLLLEKQGILVQRVLAWTGMAGLLLLSVALVAEADSGRITAYLIGDWPARLGITLVVDRLAALMVMTTTLLAIACLLHAGTGWDRRAPHFHALFQLQLMGLNGAFLTGDLFNLFVFFEVLLAASYGLLLSGGRGGRMRVGFHYVAFNIAASTLFLIALGLIYGLLGTLNMAELALRVADVSAEDQRLVQSVAGLLLVVFCSKGAILPLYLWLPATYGRAQPAVAALFVIMTKVGLYSVLRVFALMFGVSAGELAGFAWQWLLPAGIATLLLASLGTLAAVRLRIQAGYLVLASAGTLVIGFALNRAETIGAALYYLANSVFAVAAMFLIVELVRQNRVTDRMNVQLPMTDRAIAGSLYLIAAISVIGLPPLAGFIGKLTLLAGTPEGWIGWTYGTILLASFLMLVALTRAGSKLFWQVAPDLDEADRPAPRKRRGRRRELSAIMLLLGYGVAMTIFAAPVMRYTLAAGEQLVTPQNYIQVVRGQVPDLREP
ncbi:MAG: monovalent cation/H+ antiporter subunit D [Xanthomonadales bacterium]|nr:monovalent cation/H+ antiporter subunit D [Xanthomonadales bacterium]